LFWFNGVMHRESMGGFIQEDAWHSFISINGVIQRE